MQMQIENLSLEDTIVSVSWHNSYNVHTSPTTILYKKPIQIAKLVDDRFSIFYNAKFENNSIVLQHEDAYRFGASKKESESLMSKFTVEVYKNGNNLILKDNRSFVLYNDNIDYTFNNSNIICDGNSLTAGLGGTSYPTFLNELLSSSYSNFTIFNFGVSGQQTNQMIKDAAAQIDIEFDKDKLNILIAWEVGNDIYYNNNEIDAVNRFKQYCKNRKVKGFLVFAINLLPRNQATAFGTASVEYNEKLLKANSLLAEDTKGYYDALIDVASIEEFSNYNTHYDADQVHLNSAGYNLVAKKVLETIEQKLLSY